MAVIVGNILDGLIRLLIAIYLFLLASGVVPRDPEKNKQLQKWRDKFRLLVKILSILIMLHALATATGLLEWLKSVENGK